MLTNFISLFQALITGSIPIIIVKITYVLLLIIFFISIISWTYRRALCVFDAGWASYSIRNVFRLTFCLIFLLLCSFSVISLFDPTISYQANPYMIFVISMNALYTVTTLSSNYITGYKKQRILTNTFIFATWCISMISLFLLSIKPSCLCRSALYETSLSSFGLVMYKKLNPFFLGPSSKVYSIVFTSFINLFNAICITALVIFSHKIELLKSKLVSFKYIIAINSLILARDAAYFILKFSPLSTNKMAEKVIGSLITILLLFTTYFFIRFIQCEGKYDKNLKRKRVKSIKQDLNEIISDFSKIDTSKEYNNCKKRVYSLARRIQILDIKIDITKLIKIKNPKLRNDFMKMVQEVIFIEQ